MDLIDLEQVEPVEGRSPSRPSRLRRRLPLVLALVALVCALALPFAPVRMSMPVVSWPQDPQRPASTMLELTNQQPLALDVGFTCAAARTAGETAEGIVLATLVPGQPAEPDAGLTISAEGGKLRITNRGRVVLDEQIPRGDCAYQVHGTAAQLVVQRDGTPVATERPGEQTEVLPDVDVLATSLRTLPGEGDLRVRLSVDNQFNTTPTPVKQLLLALLLLCAAGSLVALWRRDRPRAPIPRADRPPSRPDPVVLAVDVLVVVTVLLWLFLAAPSDDDGYYAAMARNASAEGFVGNYYQLLNQSFTPFTWFYRLLGWWEQVGAAPVLLRVPALVAGLSTWVLLRRYVTRPGALPGELTRRPGGRRLLAVLLGGTFLAWWLPYGMGVRPEAVVGLLALVALGGVLAGVREQRLVPVAVAVGAASFALACHPTGFVAFAPVLVALPRIVTLVRGGARPVEALTRAALLLVPGALVSAAAFADGTLNDFLRGQEIFLSIQPQDSWADEFQRYGFLLTANPMGSYARRTAVLLGIAALVWFLVLAVAARARGVRLPAPLLLAGQSLGAGFFLLWLTPSKWTHHFGALAGLGPAFLALFLTSLAVVVPRVTGARRAGPWIPVLVLGTCAVTFALALRGPNQWAYSWLPGMPHPFIPPSISVLQFGSVVLWSVLALLVVGLLAVRARRGRGPDGGRPRRPVWLVAVPVLVLTFLATSLGYLLGSFGYATLRTLDGYSPWADALTDPLATGCGAASGIEVFDVSAARPLTARTPAEPAAPFVTGGGWAPADPPVEAVAGQVWGSLPTPDAQDGAGEMATGWFAVPDLADGDVLTVLAAGRLDGGNTLQVEYADAAPDGSPVVRRSQTLSDGVDAPAWRTFVLRPEGAELLRIVAGDHSGGAGGWLAFTGPSVLPVVPLTEYLPETAPVALAWQIAFLFPCQRQPVVQYGITEPAEYGVVWRPGAGSYGLVDNTWQVFRGGLFAPVRRTSAVTELGVVLPDQPQVHDIQVFRFELPFPRQRYDLRVDRVTRWGWTGPPPPPRA